MRQAQRILLVVGCGIGFALSSIAQDSAIQVGSHFVQLREVVIGRKLDVPAFIDRIKSDSSFYKAFRNLHLVNFTAVNDIRMLDRKGRVDASLQSKTRQLRRNNCRTMEVLQETTTGDFYTSGGDYNYYTASMYASLFFTKGSVCGEDNVVAGRQFSTRGKSGMEKHKEQLKMLFFSPGKRINGLPFMSSKTALYGDNLADAYDMQIDMESHQGRNCYVFRQTVKPGRKSDVVIDEMITWFDDVTLDVVARHYSLSYDAGVYDFRVRMEVEMGQVGNLLVPQIIKYNGNWKAIFKPRERGVFTAMLTDFSLE